MLIALLYDSLRSTKTQQLFAAQIRGEQRHSGPEA